MSGVGITYLWASSREFPQFVRLEGKRGDYAVYVPERTCKPETVSVSYCEDTVICSACKTVCDDLESFYYCPNCGSKVVDE